MSLSTSCRCGELQSICASCEARDGEAAVLDANFILFARLEQMFPMLSGYNNAWKSTNVYLHLVTAELSPKICSLLLKTEKPGLERSGKKRTDYWRKTKAKTSLVYLGGGVQLYTSTYASPSVIISFWQTPKCFNTCPTTDKNEREIKGLFRMSWIVPLVWSSRNLHFLSWYWPCTHGNAPWIRPALTCPSTCLDEIIHPELGCSIDAHWFHANGVRW